MKKIVPASYRYSSVRHPELPGILSFFTVPSTSTGKRKHRSMTPIQVAIKKLTLSQECLDGKLELGLPWDPLAISATAMETCQRNIQRLSVLSVQEEQGETLCLHRALFHSGETFHRASLQGEVSSFLMFNMVLDNIYFFGFVPSTPAWYSSPSLSDKSCFLLIRKGKVDDTK